MYKSFLLLFLCIPCIICIYFMAKFMCYLYTDSKKYLPVVSSFCFCVVLLRCCRIYLYVLYLYDVFHILLLPIQTYGSTE
jgi:hypothetical protein